MTDIKRHWPEIIKLLRRRVGAVQGEALDKAALLAEVRSLLPASYGVASGTVADERGQTSQPLDIVLYDRTIEPPAGSYGDSVPVRQVLAVIEVHRAVTPADFEQGLARIASVKALRPPQPVSADEAGGLPKQLFPLGLLLFDHINNGPPDPAALCQSFKAALDQLSPKLRPDFIHALGPKLLYRNPQLEGQPIEPYTYAWTFEPPFRKPRNCYICKQPYPRRHFFYQQMCSTCGDFNFAKRTHTADLRGQVALVTGARVRIGYAVVLKLLRAGATVIATSRFPHNAARAYAAEPDFADWSERLHLYGLDLRHLPSLSDFLAHLPTRYDRLDILINNAAQTVRHPPAYYAPLLAAEQTAPALPILQNYASSEKTLTELPGATEPTTALAPVAGDSWILTLEQVSMAEMLEVQLINSIAPATLIGQLKGLMLKSDAVRRFVINVTAVEGQFAKAKQGHHPHTSMAKAALNMLTHSTAPHYAADGIFINSVDPGWISEQSPTLYDQSSDRLPLDLEDAAARILDPIFSGQHSPQPPYGRLFKDYHLTAW